MGERVPVALPGGSTGTVPAAEAQALPEGSRVLSPEEHGAAQTSIAKAHTPVTLESVAGTAQAASHGAVRGFGEAFGVPVDPLEVGIAGLFGDRAKQNSRAYLNKLNTEHPYVTGISQLAGNVEGAGVASVITGNPGGGLRGAGGVAARMAMGGAENVLQATTRDVNEASLGDHVINGEKILAATPERFIIGAAFTGAFEGGAAVLGKGISALRGSAAPALEEGATRAVGREVGMTGEEGLAAGQRIRTLAGGEVPTSRGSIAELLGTEQGALRRGAAAERAGVADALAGTQATEAGALMLRQEAARKAGAGAGRAAVEEMRAAAPEALHAEMAAANAPLRQVEEHYATLRQALTEEHATASKVERELAEEHAATVRQLEVATKNAETHSGVVPKEAAAQAEREVASVDGRLTRAEFDEMIDTQLGLTGHRKDPNARRAFEAAMEKHYGAPIEPEEILAKRVENVGVTGSASASSEVSRLKGLADQLKVAGKEAADHLASIVKVARKTEADAARDLAASGRGADARIAAFQRSAAKDIAGLEKQAVGDRASFEKGATKERAALGKTHDAQIKALPKASEATSVDPLLAGLKERQATLATQPAISGNAGLGAVFSILHGNPMAAAGGLVSSFAAGQARQHGNLAAARAMRGLSEQITKVDLAVRNGTMLILGRAGARAAGSAEDRFDKDEGPAKGPSFESISRDLYAAQGNPLILEHRVREAMGDIAKDAPQTYQATLAATQRAHAFLLSVLPPPQRDPYSLTPQLTHGSVDKTTQYDFMRSFATIAKPLRIYQDVHNKSVTEQQVLAIEQVYPELYAQMRAEVDHQRTLLKEPMDYEREIHVGTLLGLMTNEVLEPDFQDLMSNTYKDKSAQNKTAGGSKSQGSGSKTSKSMMSGSESIEGEP